MPGYACGRWKEALSLPEPQRKKIVTSFDKNNSCWGPFLSAFDGAGGAGLKVRRVGLK
jgi:hypothetical protein